MLLFTYPNEDSKMFIFIHIPKNSGRYMRKEIQKRYTICNKINTIQFSSNQIQPISYIEATNDSISFDAHIEYYKIKNFNFKFDGIYIFTRNPYDRLISGYYHGLETGNITIMMIRLQKEFLFNFRIEDIKEQSKEYVVDQISNNFKKFVKILKEMLDKNILFSKVFFQQYKFMLEDINNEDLGISPNITIYKLEDYETDTEAQNFFQFEDFKIRKYNYSDYYDNETLAIVNEIYSKDFELFGYNKITSL